MSPFYLSLLPTGGMDQLPKWQEVAEERKEEPPYSPGVPGFGNLDQLKWLISKHWPSNLVHVGLSSSMTFQSITYLHLSTLVRSALEHGFSALREEE